MFTQKLSFRFIIITVLFLLSLQSAYGQVSGYTFAESAGAYSALGGTNSTASGDDGIQNGIPIGFNFVLGGTTYTHFCINTNGWIKLGNAATTIGASGWINSLGNAATHRPLLAPFWDDNHRNTGAITYSTTGASGSMVLTVDWNLINIGGGGSTSGTNFASFQLKIYETTNVVEFIYDATMASAGALTASIGLNDNTSFLSVTPGSPGTASGVTANNAIAATTDIVSKKYTFAPPAVPGTVQLSSAAYSGIEGSTKTITINRIGGQTGAISVDYATGGGSATGGAACTAGVDYITASGTRSWANNDSAAKTFDITLCTDAVSDAGETVNITLSNPLGGTSITGTNPAVLTISEPLAGGTYTVGSGGNYASLTNAGGLFDVFNTAGATTGPITVNIISDLAAETGAIALNAFSGGFTVLIKPSGAARSITGSSAASLIRLNDADKVTIDGSTAASLFDTVGGTPSLRK